MSNIKAGFTMWRLKCVSVVCDSRSLEFQMICGHQAMLEAPEDSDRDHIVELGLKQAQIDTYVIHRFQVCMPYSCMQSTHVPETTLKHMSYR